MTIAVIGGGLMGAGIAQVFLAARHKVNVFDPLETARADLKQRIFDGLIQNGDSGDVIINLTVCDQLDATVSDARFITEAAPEKLELKRSIFGDLTKMTRSDAILASNTSVIPISNIAAGLPTSERIVGTHWWNPAPLIPLVEVIESDTTSTETVKSTMALLEAVGKKPAHVKKDIPGFVANRLQHALWREAIAMVADGVCDAKTLDDCVKNSFGLRLAVLGPLENADLVGLDLTQDIHKTILPALDASRSPNPILQEKIDSGELGFKTGQGFQDWPADRQNQLRNLLTQHLIAAKDKRGSANE